MGISQAPEGRKIFGGMTVRENLEMGAYGRKDTRGIRDDFERVYTLFPLLKEREKQAGGTLSGGQQQMLAIGRALMARPKLLTLDEPSMGLAPLLVERIFELLREIHAQGTTVLLVEQNAHMALGIADRGYVIESGNIVLEDRADRLLGNDDVRKAYLGEE
jgi:branched-chain amino acid transport system ATP-binding protein